MLRLDFDVIEKCYQSHESEFQRYASLLLQWNEKINLTAITDLQDIRELHFLDSLSFSEIVSRGTYPISLLDIGAGAGCPGLPLKIAHPENIHLTLVDAVKKKCDFMKVVIRALSLKNVQVVHSHLTPENSLGEFDWVVSRAAFKLDEVLKLSHASLKPGGGIAVWKSLEIREEVEASEPWLRSYCLAPWTSVVYGLPKSGQDRQILWTRRM